nr:cyclic-phosphate processing receiver domain-containing protein [Sporosarcina sp. 6E9]
MVLLKEHGWINLYLDGLRDCPRGFVLARTVEEAIYIMRNNKVHYLSLGYDLGEDANGNQLLTGYDLVKYVCKHKLRPANKIYMHTDNSVGRNKMLQTLVAAYNKEIIDNDIEIRYYSHDGFVGG